MQMNNILSWDDLEKIKSEEIDRCNGITNSYANLRLFNNKEENVEIIFYRDRHAWCPYCQKIWLWLELKKIPYKIRKVNMYCYGEKEDWYLRKVGSGKLPAVELHGEIITESDNIISFLESKYGNLGSSIFSSHLKNPKIVERKIFRAWCDWLCRENIIFFENTHRRKYMHLCLKELEDILEESKTGFIDPIIEHSGITNPGTGDIIFIPYLERINASLCYYKGFNLREEFPLLNNWLSLLEKKNTYLGTQGDFHTHSHDLPPQMGGCFKEKNNQQIYFSNSIDTGKGLGNLEINKFNDFSLNSRIALMRVLKHKNNIINANPCDKDSFDYALRSSLTYMITGEVNKVDIESGIGLRYMRDRISVPRDMTILQARILRQSLEKIASLTRESDSHKIPTKHRFDQNPDKFKKT